MSNELENFDDLDIFKTNIEDFEEPEVQSSSSSLYKPNPKDGKDSIYRSIVRFVPDLKESSKSFVKKYTYWLQDSEGNGGYFDSPKSISWDEKCMIADTYFKLKNSKDAFAQKQSEKLGRKEYYFARVFIVKDPQNPELEGTIQVYRFPRAIKKLIDSQIKPSQEDLDMNPDLERVNVWDLLEGKDFSIKITLKGGFWNYDDCGFSKTTKPLTFGEANLKDDADFRKEFLAKYNDGPDLTPYEYRPMKQEKEDQLISILTEISGSSPAENLTRVADATAEAKAEKVTPAAETSTASESTESTSESADSGDGLDDFLDDLDLG